MSVRPRRPSHTAGMKVAGLKQFVTRKKKRLAVFFHMTQAMLVVFFLRIRVSETKFLVKVHLSHQALVNHL